MHVPEQVIDQILALPPEARAELLVLLQESLPQTPSRLPRMPERLDIAVLAAEQGIRPCDDLRQLQGIGWPAEDSIEDFEQFLEELRS